MSIVCGYNLGDANASEKDLKNAVPVQVKIQEAQDLIKQMHEKLIFTCSNIKKKQIAHDRNQQRLSHLRWEESWYQYQLNTKHGRRNIQSVYRTFDEGNYRHEVQATVGEQDELIRDLRYKLLHKSNCLAEEKKLIRQISEAEEIRETLVAHPKPEIRRTHYAKETNVTQVYRAKLQKKKYEKKVLEDLDSARKRLRSIQEIRIRMNEKKSRVHRVIYDLVKQQEQVPEAHNAANNVFITNTQLE